MLKNPGKVVCLEVHHKRTTDGSDIEVMDPNTLNFYLASFRCVAVVDSGGHTKRRRRRPS